MIPREQKKLYSASRMGIAAVGVTFWNNYSGASPKGIRFTRNISLPQFDFLVKAATA